MKNKINIWDFPSNFYIRLNKKFKKRLFSAFLSKFRSKNEAIHHINHHSSDYGFETRFTASNLIDWEKGRAVHGSRKEMWIALWVCLEMCKISEIPLDSLQKNTINYKDGERGKPICNPKLPIIVSPEFDSIVLHLLGDGCFGGYEKCASYKQKDPDGRRNMYLKLQRVFGGFELNKKEYDESWKILIPSSLVKVIKKYYDIKENARGLTTRIPQAIMKKDKDHKLASLITFIVDEGHIGDSIEMYSSNKELLEDMEKILDDLGYRHSEVKLKSRKGYKKHKYDHFRLRISLSYARKLLDDIKKLNKKYPTCYLVHKQRYLEEIILRQLKDVKRDELTKSKILEILSSESLTTKELRKRLVLCGSTIREHLEHLETKDRVKRSGTEKNSIIWSIKNH